MPYKKMINYKYILIKMLYYNFLLNQLPILSDIRSVIKKYYYSMFPRPGGSVCHLIPLDVVPYTGDLYPSNEDKIKALTYLQSYDLMIGDTVEFMAQNENMWTGKTIYDGTQLITLGKFQLNMSKIINLNEPYDMPINYWNWYKFYFKANKYIDECKRNVNYDSDDKYIYTTFIHYHMKIKVVLDYYVENEHPEIINKAKDMLLEYIRDIDEFDTDTNYHWDLKKDKSVSYVFIVSMDTYNLEVMSEEVSDDTSI